MTVTDILKEHDNWIESSPFVALIAKKRNISQRQAYRNIKKAVTAATIRKISLPDGSFLYGLPIWPLRHKRRLTMLEFIIELIRTGQFMVWYTSRAISGSPLPSESIMKDDRVIRELIKSGDYVTWINLKALM